MPIQVLSGRPLEPPVTPSQRFARAIAQSLARWEPPTSTSELDARGQDRIVCISDTHNERPRVPDGDVLVHTGDLSEKGTFDEIKTQLDWLGGLPHKIKVVIAGNHDLLLDERLAAQTNGKDQNAKRKDEGGDDNSAQRDGRVRRKEELNLHDLIYLQDQTMEIQTRHGHVLKVHGSPWTQEYGKWAFQYSRLQRAFWQGRLEKTLDILLVHGPPKGYLDRYIEAGDESRKRQTWAVSTAKNLGDGSLLREIWRCTPRLVVFGHVHAGRGRAVVPISLYARMSDEIRHLDGGILAALGLLAGFVLLWMNWMIGRKPETMTFVNAAHDRDRDHVEIIQI